MFIRLRKISVFFPKDAIIHEFKIIFYKLVFGSFFHLGTEIIVRSEPRTLL